VAKRRSKNGVNVSAAIRDYLQGHPDVGPTEAAKAISEQIGQTVSPTYVSNIKSVSKGKGPASAGPTKRRGRRRRARRTVAAMSRAAAPAASNGNVDLVTLESIKQIVSEVGADTAKRLIDLLA
jgi:hypothetical protein